MSGKILIVEDDNDINNLILNILQNAGYECNQAYSGTEGLMYLNMNSYSLIILDLMLPGLDGSEFLKKIKPKNKVPVIIVSAKDELDSKVEMLRIGADDYITKPFQNKELLARVEVQLRRLGNVLVKANEQLEYKGLRLDINNYTTILCGTEVSLTKHEFKILELLMKYPNKVFSKQSIYDYAWEEYYIGEDKTINVHISNIRKKFKNITDEEYIDTVWGIGFKLSK